MRILIFCSAGTTSKSNKSIPTNSKLYASTACISLKTLLALKIYESSPSKDEVWLSPELSIALKEEESVDKSNADREDNNSTITIQAHFIPIKYGVPDQFIWNDGYFLEVTLQDPNNFRQPVKKVGVSGGTAAFFHLRLNENSYKSNFMITHKTFKTYFIGKDLSHAVNEVTFYEEILKLKSLIDSPNVTREEKHNYKPLIHLFQYSLEYAGVLTTLSEENNKLNLLVLRNLFDNTKKLRLIDLKIGERTASAGWKGKSRTNAFRQTLFDQITNSKFEGFRLEGFESPPDSIQSILPKLDTYYSKMNNAVQSAKSKVGTSLQCCKSHLGKIKDDSDTTVTANSKRESGTSDLVKKTLKVLYQTVSLNTFAYSCIFLLFDYPFFVLFSHR